MPEENTPKNPAEHDSFAKALRRTARPAHFASRFYFFIGGIFVSELKVIFDCIRKQKSILVYICNALS